MSIENKFIDPVKGKKGLEQTATLFVYCFALATANPIASAIAVAITFRVIWEVWQEDKRMTVCL